MVNIKHFTSFGVFLSLWILPMGQAAAADLPGAYVAAFGGVTFPQSLTDARGVGSLSTVTFSDFDLERSTMYGVKLGTFQATQLRWLGIETEFFYTNPHVKQQDIETFVNGVSAGFANFAGAHVRVATWAVNWVARYPGKRFQPYVGVGPGIFWGRLSGIDLGTGSDTSLGLNALAGIRFFLTKNMALFGEYKYNRASFDFGGTAQLHVLYQVQHFTGGLSLHF